MHQNLVKPETAKVAVYKSSFFQPKLTINAPGDVYEQEADAMAEDVMRIAEPSAAAPSENSFFRPNLARLAQRKHHGTDELDIDGIKRKEITAIERKCTGCEEEEKVRVQRKESTGGESVTNDSLNNYISSLGTSGQQLPESSRQFFEPRFGRDFSKVRIHTDSVAAKSAQSINALAYASGNNIVFGEAQYSPGTDSGKKLMAHELTHVVQQVKSPSVQRFEARNHQRIELSALTDTSDDAKALSEEEAGSVYFGNWMRDLNQLFVPMLKNLGIPNDLLFSAVSYMAAKKFGRVMTPEQFGYYIPAEHIDNPGGLVSEYDLLPEQPEITPTVVPGAKGRPGKFVTEQEPVDPGTASVLNASIFSVDQTGTMAYIRRTNLHIEKRLDLAQKAGRTPEGMMHFGAALHAIEDLFAHSNWAEIAVGRILEINPQLLPALTGQDRKVFNYSQNIGVGHNSVMGAGNRPVLTTGTFTGTDTQISLASELYVILSHPLSPAKSKAEVLAEQQFIRSALNVYQSRLQSNPAIYDGIAKLLKQHRVPDLIAARILKMQLVDLYNLTTIIPPIIPDVVKLPVNNFIRKCVSEYVLQPMSAMLQTSALNNRISETSLINDLHQNREVSDGKAPSAFSQNKMKVIQSLTGKSVESQAKEERQQAQKRYDGLKSTPEAVLAGPTHSQISKDHTNSPFFGLAFACAYEADRLLRNKMIAAWDENGGKGSAPYNFDYGNFPSTDNMPANEQASAKAIRDLYHQSRPEYGQKLHESKDKGAEFIKEGGDGAPYSLANMRHDSAKQLRLVSAAFRILANSPKQFSDLLVNINGILGAVSPEQSNRIKGEIDNIARISKKIALGSGAVELRSFADRLDAVSVLVERAVTFEQRGAIHETLIGKRSEAIHLLANVSKDSAESLGLIVIIEDQIENTEGAFLAEQRNVLQGKGHISGLKSPIALTNAPVTLPPVSTNFEGKTRSSKQADLIQESRVIMDHPYESTWWVTTVTNYIKSRPEQILADIEARTQGVPLFRRAGERPEGH